MKRKLMIVGALIAATAVGMVLPPAAGHAANLYVPMTDCQFPAAAATAGFPLTDITGVNHHYGQQAGLGTGDAAIQVGVAATTVFENNLRPSGAAQPDCPIGAATFGGDAFVALEIAAYDEEWDYGANAAWFWVDHHAVDAVAGPPGEVCLDDALWTIGGLGPPVVVALTVTTQGIPGDNVIMGPGPLYDGDASSMVMFYDIGPGGIFPMCQTPVWAYEPVALGFPGIARCFSDIKQPLNPCVDFVGGATPGWSNIEPRPGSVVACVAAGSCATYVNGVGAAITTQLGWRTFLFNGVVGPGFVSTPTIGEQWTT